MAPERFTEQEATPAVDVYSLACVLYESLTGDSPFSRDSLENMVAAHLASPPPRPSVTNPRVPATFDAVIARGMAKDPDDRYGTAGGLVRAAQRAADGGRSTLVMPPETAAADPAQAPADRYADRRGRGWLLPDRDRRRDGADPGWCRRGHRPAGPAGSGDPAACPRR